MAEYVLVKTNELPEATTLEGYYAFGVNSLNQAVKAHLGAVQIAADNANDAAENANDAAALFGAAIVNTRGDDPTKVINQQKVSSDLSAIETSVANEVTARGNADNALDEKIKNLTTGHDHDGTDSKKVDHVNLDNKGTNTHIQIDAHIASTANPHGVTKAQVGLGNVDNTSDANKPVSTAQQTALNLKVDKVTGKGLSSEDYTTIEKTKLYGIAENANNYTHPANHLPSIITQDANNRFVTDAEKTTWNGKQAALGFTPENTANKKTVLNNSDTEFPTSKAVKDTTEANELTEAEAIAKLFKEVDGIKVLLAKMVTGEAWIDKLLVMSELNLFGSTNMILKATTAPIPDFIGQIFINTTSAPYVGYIAIGTASVSDWKQITN